MIIEYVLNKIYIVINALLGGVSGMAVGMIPDEAVVYLDQFFDYISAGAGLLANYVPLQFCLSLFTIILGIDVTIGVYNFVMWVVKKIPFLSIE